MKIGGRAFLVPEVLQSSAMDCGPASLQAVLEGYGVHVRYDALRERCATDVDGTSIDALARLAGELGLATYQVLVAKDGLLLTAAGCLPAIVVTQTGDGGLHFVVVWRVLGPWVQIMDPGSGRKWLLARRFLRKLPEHVIRISAARWRRWAESETAQGTWRSKLHALGVSDECSRALLEAARRDRGVRSLAILDAALRMVASLVHAGAVRRGTHAWRLLERLIEAEQAGGAGIIPERFFWVRRSGEQVALHGCVVVNFTGRAAHAASQPLPAASANTPAPPESRAPLAWLWRLMLQRAGSRLGYVALALLLNALLAPYEAVWIRSLLHADRLLSVVYQRVFGVTTVALLIVAQLGLELVVAASLRWLGRDLETWLRASLLEKLPRLDDKYLRTRPISDMANRAHALQLLREVPVLWGRTARGLLQLLSHALALVWLFPAGRAWVGLAVALALGVPLLARRVVSETSLRLRTHASALEHFHLDALLGAVAIRVHGGEGAVRAEHELRLTEWARSAHTLTRYSVWLQGLSLLASSACGVGLILAYFRAGGSAAGGLLAAYWTARLTPAAQEIGAAQLALRNLRGVLLRLLAPLGAASAHSSELGSPITNVAPHGVSVSLQRVQVRAAGRLLLRDIDLTIPAAQHVGIVGASGAGKSSLLGLLLGFVSADEGRLEVDGRQLDAAQLALLRADTAWIDPAVRLWDDSLYENLTYACDGTVQAELPEVLERADLLDVLAQLNDGLQHKLGEGGVRLSGGQGQRVRLGRGLMRADARLVLLDEPFRGLARAERTRLLRAVRAHFSRATLLIVSHDVSDTLELDRVLVLDGGRVVADAAPGVLAADPAGPYARLLQAEHQLSSALWTSEHWRRLQLRSGRVQELEAT